MTDDLSGTNKIMVLDLLDSLIGIKWLKSRFELFSKNMNDIGKGYILDFIGGAGWGT